MVHMTLLQHQTDFQECLRLASELLGGPARALDLEWKLEQMLRKQLRRIARRGIGSDAGIVRFKEERRGHEVAIGLELVSVSDAGRAIRLVKVSAPHGSDDSTECYEFWAVLGDDYRRLYRFLRMQLRREQGGVRPILREPDSTRLWDNTIGFLKRDCESLKQYGVPQKRGVLLLGEPGNGKTMACRWLRGQCVRQGLDWKSVSAEEYDSMREKAEAHELFELERPGVVFFDDLDMALRDRAQVGTTRDHSTFLAALDGLDVKRGVVYIFTSNATLVDLDPAFRRPGRIDLVMTFERPDAELRRRLITEAWHADIVAHLAVESVVRQTDGFSFAEMEELKKLLVLHQLDSGEWSWSAAWQAFQAGCEERDAQRIFGFNRPRFTTMARTLSVPQFTDR